LRDLIVPLARLMPLDLASKLFLVMVFGRSPVVRSG
jgi:hypothetical protein